MLEEYDELFKEYEKKLDNGEKIPIQEYSYITRIILQDKLRKFKEKIKRLIGLKKGKREND